MIHSVSANQPGFRPVHFSPGLNLIVADRHETATDKDTRNGVGKSLLLDIIHYCLGSNAFLDRQTIASLKGWEFQLDLTIGSRRVTVTRSLSASDQVRIGGDIAGWEPLGPQPALLDHATAKLPPRQWIQRLGSSLFDLPAENGDTGPRPSFRTLMSYLGRRREEGYLSPLTWIAKPTAPDRDLHLAYLLGMNWECPRDWSRLNDKDKELRALQKVIAKGVVAGTSATMGELESRRVRLEHDAERSAAALRSFKVHPNYDALQKDADRLTAEIHELQNRDYTDRQILSRYRESTKEESPPKPLSVEAVYEDAGIVFPDQLKRTLSEARRFYRQIVRNRSRFLKTEIERLERTISERRTRIEKLTEERASVMQVLATHGALSEHSRLQERHVALHERLQNIRTQIANVERLNREREALDASRVEIKRAAKEDYEALRPIREAALRWFNENSTALYEAPGNLVIDVGAGGYQYRAEIERSASEGIGRMLIFCFDLTVLQLQKRLGRGMDFLIHDSLMFDPVDTRQRARALERAHRVTSEIGAQYICALNSDMVPEKDFSDGFDYEQFVRLRLSDESPEGRLLGIHF